MANAFALPFSAAQTAAPKAQPSTTKPSSSSGTSAKPVTRTGAVTSVVKLPPGVPVVKGVLKTAFSLRYEDFKIGTGALAEPGKVYHVHYTGWLASDGTKFDSSFDHQSPVMGTDGKPEMDADGKPNMAAQPLIFPQGRGRLIPGWDQGFEGMRVGGKRRLFIPYQLAYGAMGRPPKIPAKSDLIFDVELTEVSELPAAPVAGAGPAGRPIPPRPGAAPVSPATPASPAPAAKPADPAQPQSAPNPAGTAAPSAPATPPAPTQPQPSSPTAPPDKPVNPEQPK